VTRSYKAEDVVRLRGTVAVEHSLARLGAEVALSADRDFVNALGALTGNQAMQQVKAGRRRSTCQAGRSPPDANVAGEMYPDQSRVPGQFRAACGQAHQQHAVAADQVNHAEGITTASISCSRSWPTPKPVSAAS
jgi:isocitrate lyase